MYVPEGFLFSAISCGIRKRDRLDLGLIYCKTKGIASGVFTKNTVKAAPVIIGKKHIKNLISRAILVNSGIANACTGEEGLSRAEKLIEECAKLLNIQPEELLPASTGVIGEQLPLERILPKLPELVKGLSETKYDLFAQAIMTTDTFPKIVSKKTEEGITLLGIAKGAGMIAPHMATMLAFVLTDATIKKEDLKSLLDKAVEKSFNCITIDGDTSTNDTLYAMASGIKNIERWEEFVQAFMKITKELAYLIVKDGEGASKVIRIIVKGAKTKEEAKRFAKAVAESPLVKTAIYGADPNWGRIFATLGKTEIAFDPSEIELYLNGLPWIKNLEPQNEEKTIKEQLTKREIELVIKLKSGKQSFEMWTCDLTEEYIKINASYRS
ncbi:MAG: bifunctional glutamate N-acetyltransferase/amino-acid acetyltransferase ArgJ [Caldimicrobium sp.]|nr:bifunctional glutamate N-acetyltransferase/amino-acid acetyltransferase ArgJ [Caldimicrobium sp.]MCX7873797.1 bifunctional glutamate N-acetyltransferase/amino-acid acetyltransferase ArgJ [Caldimicrobium sp.]MDW8094790.1 bifunctional glutamate N-acetyltransferase/amino-acid acetyltransferase ArgJ [Caldimicrobium sp.]